MDIVEEYIKKIVSLSNLTKDEILKRVMRKKEGNKGLTDIGAIFMIKSELGLDFTIKPRSIYYDADRALKEEAEEQEKKEAALREKRELESYIRKLEKYIQDKELREILILLREGRYRRIEIIDLDYVIFETIKTLHQKLLDSYGFKRDKYRHFDDDEIYQSIHNEDEQLIINFYGYPPGRRFGFRLIVSSQYPESKRWEYQIDIDYLAVVDSIISDLSLYFKDVVENVKQSRILTNKGLDLAIQGQFSEAIEVYDKALELEIDNFFTYTNKGIALMELGKIEDAKYNFNLAMKISKKEASWLAKSTILKLSGENEKALQCYDNVLKFNPNNINALYYKGILLEQFGKFSDALRCITRTLEINADHKQAIQAKKRLLK